MNKMLNVLKNIISLITFILSLYLFKIVIIEYKILIYLLIILYILVISMIDFFNKIKLSNKFNLLQILVQIICIFLILRMIFDFNFHSIKDTDILKEFLKMYFNQNFFYLLIMYVCIIIYHSLEYKNIKNTKYNELSILTFIINIGLILPSIMLISNSLQSVILFILTEIILLILEIYLLIKDNNKKKELFIFLSIILQAFGFFSIFIYLIAY